MGLTGFLVIGAVGAAACSKSQPAKAPEADPAFDSQWTSLASQGVEAVYIEDDRGEGLMGNVRRASRPPAAPSLQPQAVVDPNAPLPPAPSGDEIQRVIRSNLAAVKGCYMTMARSGTTRSGKAIVSFQIAADGRPAGVKVDAPSFSGTGLPNCVVGQVAHWSFPKSQKGGGSVSYPFVFVGS